MGVCVGLLEIDRHVVAAAMGHKHCPPYNMHDRAIKVAQSIQK